MEKVELSNWYVLYATGMFIVRIGRYTGDTLRFSYTQIWLAHINSCQNNWKLNLSEVSCLIELLY